MLCAAAVSPLASSAADKLQGDTVTVTGKYLSEPMKVTVVTPSSYLQPQDTTRYPVAYLLNGHGGNYKNWSTIVDLDKLADDYGCIVVCPSGMNSWYWDSPEKPGLQMESFITKELVPYIDSNYRTRTDSLGRAVTGFSMGGHGALWLAIRHSDIFGSAGSTSGGVNIIPFPERWNMAASLGKYEDNKERWEAHTVKNLVDSIAPGQINIIFDCGTEDFFYDVNCDFDKALNDRKIHHVYITGPGAHTGQYWSKSIFPHMEFFRKIWNKE
jgi:S-formylglutathione hydrolase FrmB